MPSASSSHRKIVVITAPSGSGKNTLINALLQRRNDLEYSISSTTRPARRGEVHGKNYWFLPAAEFEAEIKAGNFLEYASVIDNFYGTSIREIERIFKNNKTPILDIDVQGARTLLKKNLNLISIFIRPPSLAELRRRLEERATETQEQIDRRIRLATEELDHAQEFQYRVLNDNLENAIADLNQILDKELGLGQSS